MAINHHSPLTHCETGNQTVNNDFRLALVHMDGPCLGLFGQVPSLPVAGEGGKREWDIPAEDLQVGRAGQGSDGNKA